MFVRWSNLTLSEEEQRRLPGYREEAVVRRFDAPEALETRFYEVRARSVLNLVPAKSRMPFRWTINPYRGCSHACIYCFARPTHKYLDFDAGRDFEREIVVKVNAPEALRVELARPSWKGEHVALGTNTDPYQWVEGRYRLMVGIWEAMRDFANPCSVLTKSPLLLRDLPLMLQIARRAGFSACLSIPTLDEKAWRATEPHTPNPRARLEAVAELNRAGIPTGVLIAPLMPGINDAPRQLEPLLRGAIDAGATSVGGVALHLRGDVKGLFMDWLRDQRPELVSRYEELYVGGAYASKKERERLSKLVRRGANRGFRPLGARLTGSPEETPAAPIARQQTLFSALVELTGVHRPGDLIRAELARDAGRELRGETGEGGAYTNGERGDVDLAAVALDRLNGRAGDVLGTGGADARGELDARLGEHAGVADEAGEDRRDADAACAQVRAQGGGEAAQAELGRVVDRSAGGRRLAGEGGHEQQVSAAARDHRRDERVREGDRGAQVDVERAVDLLHRERLQASGRGQRGVGHENVEIAGLTYEAIDLGGV